MVNYFTLDATPGHVGIEFGDAFVGRLEALRQQAEDDGAGRSGSYEPEVQFLQTVILELRRELPETISSAGWPPAMGIGDKLDEFIVMALKDPARAARGRGTNASAKLAIARLSAGAE